jgi:hypothetical protein
VPSPKPAAPSPKPTPAPAAPVEAPKPAAPAPAPAPTVAAPSGHDLKSAVQAMLKDANMEEVSMKSVRQALETKFGQSLSDRKGEIKEYVNAFLEQ